MSNFREDLKAYFEEARKYNWEDFIINQDLDRMIQRYEDETLQEARDNIECELRERLERAHSCVEDALDYLEVD